MTLILKMITCFPKFVYIFLENIWPNLNIADTSKIVIKSYPLVYAKWYSSTGSAGYPAISFKQQLWTIQCFATTVSHLHCISALCVKLLWGFALRKECYIFYSFSGRSQHRYRDSPAQKMYVPKGHAAQIFMCLYAFLCAFLIRSIKVNKSLHI